METRLGNQEGAPPLLPNASGGRRSVSEANAAGGLTMASGRPLRPGFTSLLPRDRHRLPSSGVVAITPPTLAP